MKRHAALWICLVLFCVLAPTFWFSVGVYQGGDTFEHFQIARYAFAHPTLFLDHWGKPVFTALYSIPAQLGFRAARVFTLIIGLAAAFMTYRLARSLHLKNAWASIFLVLFAPMYMVMMNSVMTEVLFSFVLVSGIYLLVQNRFLGAALLLSFLPLVRTEGFVLLPFVAIWFLLHGQWKTMLLLCMGSLVYSVLGLISFGDFFWLITRNPYPLNVAYYGSGSWLHFVSSNKVIWGIPLSLLVVLGWFGVFKQERDLSLKSRPLLVLVCIPFLVFLVFHSTAWALGKMASLGETRVMVSTMPLVAIIALSGIFQWVEKIPNKLVKKWIPFVLIAPVVLTPFALYSWPMQRTPQQQLTHEVSSQIEKNYPNQKIWFVDPQVGVELQRDPFAGSNAQRYFPVNSDGKVNVAPGDLVLWDSHFSPHEGLTPLSVLQKDSRFSLLLKRDTLTKQNQIFELYLFQCEHSKP